MEASTGSSVPAPCAKRGSSGNLLRDTILGEPAFASMSRSLVGDVDGGSMLAPEGTTLAGTTSNLITVMIGVGILTFPSLFAKVGWYCAPVLLLTVALVTAEIGMITDRSLRIVETMAVSRQFSFGLRAMKTEDFGEACFGKPGKAVVGILSNSFLLFILSTYLILIGNNMESLSDGTFFHWPTRAWVLLMTLLVAPTSLLQDMSRITRLAPIGVISSVMYVVIIIAAGLYAACNSDPATKSIQYRQLPPEYTCLGQVFALMLFGFMYVIVLPTVRANMRHPTQMPKAIAFSTYASVIIYCSCGLIGYYGWGIAVKDSVVDSMAPAFGKVMSATVVINLVVSYPILMNCAVVAMEMLFGTGYSVILRLSLVLVTAVVCLVCPFFMAVVGLGSSALGVIIGVFLPLIVYWRLGFLTAGRSCKACLREHGVFALMRHVVIFCIGVFVLWFGVTSSWADLMKDMQMNSPNPFDDFFGYLKKA